MQILFATRVAASLFSSLRFTVQCILLALILLDSVKNLASEKYVYNVYEYKANNFKSCSTKFHLFSTEELHSDHTLCTNRQMKRVND